VLLNGLSDVVGTHWAVRYAKALGCRVGANVELHALPPVTGLATFGDGSTVESEVDLAGWWLDGDVLKIGSVAIGAGARVGARSTLMPGSSVADRADVVAGSAVTGVDATPVQDDWPPARPVRRRRIRWAWSLGLQLLSLLPIVAAVPGLLLVWLTVGTDGTLDEMLLGMAAVLVPATLISLLCYAVLLALAVRVVGQHARPGLHRSDGGVAWCAWFTTRLTDTARTTLFPIYAGMLTPLWLRMMGARIGRGVEASTVHTVPSLLCVADGAFLADDTLLAPMELRGGWLRLGCATVGARAFVGNSGIVGADHDVPASALIGVLSTAPADAPEGSSWLGRPSISLPRTADGVDSARTFAPPRRLRLARAAVETGRLLPMVVAAALAEIVAVGLAAAWQQWGFCWSVLISGPVLLAAGAVAGLLASAAKWLLVGRFRTAQHPLWSSFVWRNELADTFVEELAVPWLGRLAEGTPLLTGWLRTLGATIGRGAWIETHWLPEADLVHIGAGASVNRGCVVQTHLFHDRLMRLDKVRLDDGATLGPHSIVLPGSTLGAAATVGAASLVMRDEQVPANTRWLGNPVSDWRE
jgi:non-ribosomal peptide synthetase-like protein